MKRLLFLAVILSWVVFGQQEALRNLTMPESVRQEFESVTRSGGYEITLAENTRVDYVYYDGGKTDKYIEIPRGTLLESWAVVFNGQKYVLATDQLNWYLTTFYTGGESTVTDRRVEFDDAKKRTEEWVIDNSTVKTDQPSGVSSDNTVDDNRFRLLFEFSLFRSVSEASFGGSFSTWSADYRWNFDFGTIGANLGPSLYYRPTGANQHQLIPMARARAYTFLPLEWVHAFGAVTYYRSVDKDIVTDLADLYGHAEFPLPWVDGLVIRLGGVYSHSFIEEWTYQELKARLSYYFGDSWFIGYQVSFAKWEDESSWRNRVFPKPGSIVFGRYDWERDWGFEVAVGRYYEKFGRGRTLYGLRDNEWKVEIYFYKSITNF
ncbi:MAG: hypothetical protein NUV82_01185 [Candidatus Komeilibacteria bacterium]|nr:hypothetical protein [Candidatus Komeilibacteria bacterium]